MEIKKPNDILIATLDNPNATVYDLMSNGFSGENTSFFTKDEYKQSKFIQDSFKDEKGQFDENLFNQAYDAAQNKFLSVTNDAYLDKYTKELDQMEYSPFDITRPKFAKTFNVSATLQQDYNPLKELKGWTGLSSVDQNPLSLREIAQQNKVFDPETNSWSDKSLNDLNVFDKMFGSTLVYATYDEDTTILNPLTGELMNMKKGDFKVDDNGDIFTEKLGNREVYGRQVVNPTDILTTDGSLIDQFNFLDSDGREKSVLGTTMKIATEIAPFFIPGGVGAKIATAYAGTKAALSLASVLPTFYKSLEGLLLGDDQTTLTKGATQLENYFSKYTTASFSDESGSSLFNYEQLGSMVSDIFSQVYEQRAMASLSKIMYKADSAVNYKAKEFADNINKKLVQEAMEGKIDFNDIKSISEAAMAKIPELQSVIKAQSKASKALSLGYMALTSTGDIYGQALAGGYDRRTAGFAALAAAAGQYGIMSNNRMGDWFLDKTTGYTQETNKTLMRQSLTPWLDDIKKVFATSKNSAEAKVKLSETFAKIKGSISDTFNNPAVIGEALWKNALIEGVEEVTEEVVLDATKGIVDVMSYLGMAKKSGTFDTWNNITSKSGLERYLASLFGGVLGGGLFEINRSVIQPWLDPQNALKPETKKSLYELIAGGHKDALIQMVNEKKASFGNNFISPFDKEGNFVEGDKSISQADVIANRAIDMINMVDGIINSQNLGKSDEEILDKAIRDKIIINRLEKIRPDGANIGLEGLVLDDYKETMSKIVDLNSEINSAEEGSERAKQVKEQLKTNTDKINGILNGEYGLEYFGKAEFYLNSKINSPYLLADRNAYANKTYGVNYSELPKTGAYISQERIDKEWNEYIESKDLKKSLNVSYKVYTELEKILNKPIADYAATGYDVERKRTLKNVLDIKATIDLFNIETDDAKKELLFQNFINLNNELESAGHNVVTPWDVIHTDLIAKLFELGVIKKDTLTMNENGEVMSTVTDFSEDDLQSANTSGIVRKDRINEILAFQFKKILLNPLNLKSELAKINVLIDNTNKSHFSQIFKLQQKEVLTEQEQAKLLSLQEAVIDFKLDDIENANIFKSAINEYETRKEEILSNAGLKDADLIEYEFLIANKTTIKELISDLTKLEEFTILPHEDTELADKEFHNIIDALTKKIESSPFFEESLKNANITAEQYYKLIDDIQSNSLENSIANNSLQYFELTHTLLDGYLATLNSKNYEEAKEELVNAKADLTASQDLLMPGIFKFRNYAFDVLVAELKSGNADKELFNSTRKMFKEESAKLIASTFPGTELSYEEFLQALELFPAIYKDIKVYVEEDNLDLNDFGKDTSLTTYISQSDIDDESKAILKKLVNNDYQLGIVEKLLREKLDSMASNKETINSLNSFLEVEKSGIVLKSNPLYDFIRNFVLTLNSNPNAGISKIFDILEKEESSLRSGTVSNFSTDNIREQDIDQAVNALEMIKSVIYAMSTTEVDFGDPYGFLAARQNYAKKYNIEDDVTGLVTITSDLAELMKDDVNAIITKLKFIQGLSTFNSGKLQVEQEIIRSKVSAILLNKWRTYVSKMNPSFLPIDDIKKILESDDADEKKLMLLENAVFLKNVDQKEKALENFLSNIEEEVSAEEYTIIDKEVKDINGYELSVYFATVLGNKSEDFYIRSLNTITGGFTKAPFFSQEWAARVTKASTAFPKLFSKIYDIKQNTKFLDNSSWTLIFGAAGTGKSTATLGLVLDNFRQSNDMSDIWISAPNKNRVEGLKQSILDTVGNDKMSLNYLPKIELYEKLGIGPLMETLLRELSDASNPENTIVKLINTSKGTFINFVDSAALYKQLDNLDIYSTLPNLLVFDEVTHLSLFEAHILHHISTNSQSGPYKYMKLIGLGDPTQRSFRAVTSVGGNAQLYDYSITKSNAIFTPRLWTSIRSANNQKRGNNEVMSKASRKIENIYRKAKKDFGDDWEPEAEKQALTELKIIQDDTKLAYYQNSDENKGQIAFNGDRIVNSFTEVKDTLKAITTKYPESTFGVITRDGNLSEEMMKNLQSIGLINQDGTYTNLKVYTPSNVQGDEMDYVIFDADLLSNLDKIRDVFESFYTFITRSVNGTVIIDNEGFLATKFIQNKESADKHTIPVTPLNSNTIKIAKDKKQNDITELVGSGAKPSDYDNFKWKVGAVTAEDNSTSQSGFTPTSVESELKKLFPATDPKNQTDANIAKTAEGFGIMLHSFYNNPGIELDAERNISKIAYNQDRPRTDLNFTNETDPNKVNQIVKEWADLKYYLLNNMGQGLNSIESNAYRSILEKIFGQNSTVSIEFKTTVVPFEGRYNTPFAKHGFKKEEMLSDKDPFINLSAKLSIGDNVYYVTLATLATEKTLFDTKKVTIPEGVNKEAIAKQFAKIKGMLGSLPSASVLELNTIEAKELDFVRGTWLSVSGNYPLNDLGTAFPGATFSNIKLFPATEAEFIKLFNRYTFGTARTVEDIRALYTSLKNKPYIVASYKDDVQGSAGNKTHAVIIPITTKNRGFDTMFTEVTEAFSKKVNNITEALNDINSPVIDFDKINTEAETLLHRSDIIDMLLIMNNNGLLDKLASYTLEFGGKKVRLLDLLAKGKRQKIQLEKLETVIGKIKELGKIKSSDTKSKEFKDKKEEAIKAINGITHWHWVFINLFSLDAITSDELEIEFGKLFRHGAFMSEDEINAFFKDNSDKLKEVKTILSEVKNAISKNKKEFYYSIPIKYDRDTKELVVNPYVSGESNGLSNSINTDKFFINRAPESGRLILGLNTFLGDKVVPVIATPNVPNPAPTPESKPATPVVPEVNPLTTNLKTLLLNALDSKIDADKTANLRQLVANHLELFNIGDTNMLETFINEVLMQPDIENINAFENLIYSRLMIALGVQNRLTLKHLDTLNTQDDKVKKEIKKLIEKLKNC